MQAPKTPPASAKRWPVGKFSGNQDARDLPASGSSEIIQPKATASRFETRYIPAVSGVPDVKVGGEITPTEPCDVDPCVQPTMLPEGAAQPAILEDAASMQARAANVVLEQAQTQLRVDALRQMLEAHAKDDLELHTEEDIAIDFASLFRELQARIFELDSSSQTVKQYLGEKAKQDSETATLVGDNKVPREVYLYLRFISAREIQRKRNYLYTQGEPAPSVKQWKQYLRDDTRRRIRGYLLGQNGSAFGEKPVEESSVPAAPINVMQKKKAAAKERGINLNQVSQQRKRQRQAGGSSSKKPGASLCDQARDLIARFGKLVTDNAKHGDFVEAIAAAIKRSDPA